MALHSSSLFAWVPSVEVKKDPKQTMFDIPRCLMPLNRQIFYRRYVCDVAGTAGYQVHWLDEGTNPTRTIHVEDGNDISIESFGLTSHCHAMRLSAILEVMTVYSRTRRLTSASPSQISERRSKAEDADPLCSC